MKRQIFKGILTDYERRNSSIYGNPKYYGVFEATNGDILRGTTGTDCACAYSFLNNQTAEKEIEYHETKTGNIVIDYIR